MRLEIPPRKSAGSKTSRKESASQSALSRDTYYSFPGTGTCQEGEFTGTERDAVSRSKDLADPVQDTKAGSSGQNLSRLTFSRHIATLVSSPGRRRPNRARIGKNSTV